MERYTNAPSTAATADATQRNTGSFLDTLASAAGNDLTSILTSMQQGVTAINNLTKTMKAIFPLLLLLMFSLSVHAAENYPRSPNGPGAVQALFINTTLSDQPAPSQWITVDVAQSGLPADTQGIGIGGFLIITDGTEQGIANLTLALRSYGDTQVSCDNYIGQAISVNPPSGQGMRQVAYFSVGLNQGKFEYCWQRGIVGSEYPNGNLPSWPSSAAYAINLTIQRWTTP